MAEQKKNCPTFKVYSPSDLSKKWFIYFYQEGKRVRKYGDVNSFDKRKDRLKAVDQLIKQLTNEYGQPTKSIKEKLYDRVEVKKNFHRKKTHQCNKSKLNMLFDFLDTDNPTKEDMESFFEHLMKTRHPTTYAGYIVKLKSFFDELGIGNYFDDVKRIKFKMQPKRYFQTYQTKKLKKYITENQPSLWLCIQLLYYCFIRPGESRLLTAGHFQMDEEKIMIPGEVSKNGKTQYVAIPKALVSDLQFVRYMAPNEYIFPGKKGHDTIGHNTMNSRHTKVLKELGFSTKEYSLYSWKHTGAVMAVKNGISLKDLQIQLRHHSLDQVDQYLRQLGVTDLGNLRESFPEI